MSVDPELDEFENTLPGPIAPLSRHTIRVAELLRTIPGARERWRQQCRESYQQSAEGNERHKEWERGRLEHLKQAWELKTVNMPSGKKFNRVKMWCPVPPPDEPPLEGWVKDAGRSVSPDGKSSECVEVWMPREFSIAEEPFNSPVMQFSAGETSLADDYFALVVVHDYERRGRGKIEPFDKDELAWVAFYAQSQAVPKLSDSARLALDDCLARVEADLRETELRVDVTESRSGSGSEPIAGTNAIRDLAEKVETIETLIKAKLGPVMADVKATLPEDGPTMPGFFFVGGQPHPFPPLQWRLLNALWGKGSVSFENIGDEVYEGEEAIEGKLRKLVKNTNDKMLKIKLPFDINSPMDGHYILQKLPPVTPQVTEK